MMNARMTILVSLVLGLGMAFGQSGLDLAFRERAAATDLRASSLMGATVYLVDAPQVEVVVDGVPDEWESVANVDDVLVSQSGALHGVLLDVGGFLGIGARTVMVDMDALQLVLERDTDVVHVLLQATREELENAPEFDPSSVASIADVGFAGRAGVPALRTPGFVAVETSALTADDLTDAVVYDRFGDRVTGIGEVVLSDDGASVESVVVDVGGFLGLFAHSVRVDVEQLDVVRDSEMGGVRVYLDLTQEELEALPVHDG